MAAFPNAARDGEPAPDAHAGSAGARAARGLTGTVASVAQGARHERGSATVEFAITVPALVLVVALCMAVFAVCAARLAAMDGARTGARLAATSASAPMIADAASRTAGAGSQIDVIETDGWIEVVVSRPVVTGLGTWRVSERAVIPGEAIVGGG